MSHRVSHHPPGFVLESADSVRFGPDYTPDEAERNRQMLFGELLCGLLMGEQFWTNAVFAFDSRGAVEALGAVARGFLRCNGRDQFMPFILSVYPQDKDTLENQSDRPWRNPGELFLRCYAHRLNNPDFILSATPDLNHDTCRRRCLAAEIGRISRTGGMVDDIQTSCSSLEQEHLRNILGIDRYFRSWLGDAVDAEFDGFASSAEGRSSPIRLNRLDWSAFNNGEGFKKLRFFLQMAESQSRTEVEIPQEPLGVLREALQLPDGHAAFKNRSSFRVWLGNQGHSQQSEVYRMLTELSDGHYVRTQQSVLTFADREVTSPASPSTSSQAGEKWASATMKACTTGGLPGRSWQFINEIKAATAAKPLRIDLDSIAQHFADYMCHPVRRRELLEYHQLLAHARREMTNPGGTGTFSMQRLVDVATGCCNNINAQLSRNFGVRFQFNANDQSTGAGSLTFVYLDNVAISQCTGPSQAVTQGQSEGAAHPLSPPT